jgi:hypothetical protein
MTHPVDPSVTVVVTENNPDMLRVYWQTPLDPFPSVIGLGSRVVIERFARTAPVVEAVCRIASAAFPPKHPQRRGDRTVPLDPLATCRVPVPAWDIRRTLGNLWAHGPHVTSVTVKIAR